MIMMGNRSGPAEKIQIIDYVTRKDVREKFRLIPRSKDYRSSCSQRSSYFGTSDLCNNLNVLNGWNDLNYALYSA